MITKLSNTPASINVPSSALDSVAASVAVAIRGESVSQLQVNVYKLVIFSAKKNSLVY